MANTKTIVKKTASNGEKMLKIVTEQLNNSLTSLKEKLGEKKFEKRIKKAAKKLVAGIEKKPAVKAVAKAAKAIPVKKKVAKPALKKAK